MKLLTTASYYGSGSSAITDLLSEYETIKTLNSDFECRIAHDMFGLSDLEYYLSENYHRHNSSVAINMFRRLCGIYGLNKFTRLENYPLYLGGNFQSAVNRYITKLSKHSFPGGAHTDLYMSSDLRIFKVKLKDFLYKKIHSYHPTIDDSSWLAKGLTPYEKEIRKCKYNICFPSKKFLEYTREFTDDLFSSFIDQNTKFLMVDQLVPPSNTMRYIRYFDDIKVICVDRDPRDIYYNEKKYWRGGVVPDDPYLFIEWFKSTRAHKNTEADDPSIIKRILFEELVLNYDKTVSEIESFLGLSPSLHSQKKSKFNPEISIKNIGKWKSDASVNDEINIIENGLANYISKYE